MPYWDRFDICEAWYVFAMLHHSGQWSEEYGIFGRLHRIGFKPRPNLDVDVLSTNAFMIYDQLVKRQIARIGCRTSPKS